MTAEANEATTMPKSSPTIQILHRWTRTVLFEAAAESMKAALLMAISQDANLTRADLTGAILPAGYRWEAYLAEVVPALLMAGGKPLADVLAALKARGGWAACHQWSNCPLHEAFGADGLDGVPPLYRWEAAQFVQLFDAGLIPEPVLPESARAAAKGGQDA